MMIIIIMMIISIIIIIIVMRHLRKGINVTPKKKTYKARLRLSLGSRDAL